MPKKKKIEDLQEPLIPTLEEKSVLEPEGSEKRAFFPSGVNSKIPRSRFSVFLNDDGSPDYASMRADTKDKLKAIISDPKTRELFADLKVPEIEIISDQDILMLYDLISMIETYAFTIAGKIDHDIAQKHAIWTPEQKQIVFQPTKNVIVKNAGTLAPMLRWKDEIVLTLLLVTITRAKYDGARKEQSQRNEDRRNGIQQPGPPAPGPLAPGEEAVQ